MEVIFFKSDTTGPVKVWTTPDGKIDFCALGVEFGLEPGSIKLGGDRFPYSDGESKASWTQIKNVLGVAGTKEDPVMVEGRQIIEAPRGPSSGVPDEAHSKKAKRSRDEFQFLVPADSEVVALQSYFKKLLEAPLDLPESAKALREFLSTRTEKLPVLEESTFYAVDQPDLVKPCASKAEKRLASFVEVAFAWMSGTPPVNEATSSAQLYYLTGVFLQKLDSHAANFGLLSLSTQLDSTGATGTSALSALKPLKRPDFLLFVRETLILRWENKIDVSDIAIAIQENASKLCVWSPLYYGTLPFVIGGCCGGGLFQWLKLSPVGKKIAVEPISEFYDLKKPRGVALLLHSTIRMHCLLQKLQQELTFFPPVKLYTPIPRSGGGEVIVYPDRVYKAVMPPLDMRVSDMLESLYDSIHGSRYLIQLISIRTTQKRTTIWLEPVGDPNAQPGVLNDLAAAVHDILHGLADLHKQGYTHRDLRWENCIKVNVQGEWKWVIIDLEAAGVDEEEWVGDGLRSWDAGTLEDRDGKKIYTKGSDMYQLGKLIVEWLDTSGKGGEEDQAMRARGENMQQERGAAVKMLEDICKKGCERCGKFDT